MLLEYKMIQMYNQVQLHCENHILRTGNTYSKSLHPINPITSYYVIQVSLELTDSRQMPEFIILAVWGLYTVRALYNCIIISNAVKTGLKVAQPVIKCVTLLPLPHDQPGLRPYTMPRYFFLFPLGHPYSIDVPCQNPVGAFSFHFSSHTSLFEVSVPPNRILICSPKTYYG